MELLRLVAATDPPLQTAIFAGIVTVGVGLTVMVYVDGVPVHVLAAGVTVIVAVIGLAVVLVALKAAIFPEPLPAMPIAVLLFVHVKLVPAVGLVKLVAAIEAVLHTVTFAGTLMVGVGFTVIVNDAGVPEQLLAEEFTVMLAVIGSAEVFVAVKPAMFPEPLAANPMAGLLLVQE